MIKLDNSRGWFKVHKNLFDDPNLNGTEVFFLEFIIDQYVTLRNTATVDGIVYKQFSNEIVGNKGLSIDPGTIKTYLDHIEKAGYIKTGSPHKHGRRYIHLCVEYSSEQSSEWSTEQSNEQSSEWSTEWSAENSRTVNTNNTTKTIKTDNTTKTSIQSTKSTSTTKIDNDILIDKNKNINTKNSYGNYNHVKLTDNELQQLKNEFTDGQEGIYKVDNYCESTGKKYKNYLATIRNWSKNEKHRSSTNNLLLFVPQENVSGPGTTVEVSNDPNDNW